MSLPGLVVLSVALVLTGGLVAGFVRWDRAPASLSQPPDHDRAGAVPPGEVPAWGELIETDVTLEQPEEYVAYAAMTEPGTTWNFQETDPEKIRATLLACGLSPEQAAGVLAAGAPLQDGAGWRSRPQDALVLSIRPDARARLYDLLARNPANISVTRPFYIPEGSFDAMFVDSGVPKSTLELVRQLLYPAGRSQCFSDVGLVLGRIPDEKTKLDFVKALTRQTAVLARLRIHPDSDIDKIVGYWAAGSGTRAKDIRPMLEALRRLHDGGSVGLGFLLPPFARERLYTTPEPTKAGDIAQDCHWSAMNFFNEKPDARFADRAFVGRYIDENYYQIARPALLGDLIFFLNDQNQVIHSAVHVAGDLVFTKNGENYAQPWILTRRKNLEGAYLSSGNFQAVYYRRKNL